MYEELVKALRDMSEMGMKYGMAVIKMREAADAIEKLCGLCASQSKDCSEAVAKYIELWAKQPRWIPVTERLPERRKETYWVCTDTGHQCECRWTNDKYGLGASDRWGWSIFDPPQCQVVVAWRDLTEPFEPPKEE